MEQTDEKVIMVGTLSDLGLGNPDGIPSKYTNSTPEELQTVAENDLEMLVAPNDLSCTACIDGRRTISNADGSEAKVRLRRVGGSASNLGVALNGEASVVDTFSQDDSLGSWVKAVDAIGGSRSAHRGGCGGANGEVDDNRAIHDNPAVLGATRALMEIPEVKAYLGVGYSDELAERVRQNAAKTARLLEENGWNGQAYVDGVVATDPDHVEDLEVDHEDVQFHGHKEATLKIIIGDKTYPGDDEFVWNLRASKEICEKLAGQRGTEGYQQLLIAEIAKHMAVAHRLPSDKTPFELLAA